MESKLNVTETEIYSALLKELAGREGVDQGASAKQLSAALGRSLEWVRRRIEELTDKGLLEFGFRPGENVIGRPKQTPVYWLKKDE